MMEIEDDDDIYASGTADELTQAAKIFHPVTKSPQDEKGQKPADLEEGEEEDEDEEDESDSVTTAEPR